MVNWLSLWFIERRMHLDTDSHGFTRVFSEACRYVLSLGMGQRLALAHA